MHSPQNSGLFSIRSSFIAESLWKRRQTRGNVRRREGELEFAQLHHCPRLSHGVTLSILPLWTDKDILKIELIWERGCWLAGTSFWRFIWNMLNSKLKSIAVITNLNYGILSIRLKRDRIIKERRNHSVFNWMSSCLNLFLFFITECDLRSFVPFPTGVWDVLCAEALFPELKMFPFWLDIYV